VYKKIGDVIFHHFRQKPPVRTEMVSAFSKYYLHLFTSQITTKIESRRNPSATATV